MENISGAKDNHEDEKDMAHDNEALIQENEKVEPQTVTRKYWGWLVVLASFLNIAIIDGVGYTAGILLDSLLEELGGGRGGVAVAGSLQVGVYSLSGPLVGRLITWCGARPVCIAGAFISCVGLLGASFSTSLGSVLIGDNQDQATSSWHLLNPVQRDSIQCLQETRLLSDIQGCSGLPA